ncbi:HAD hydrolase-like protein [Candidatus Woesearchaeota archaeon]|nr:HAD hydrolase-like protein [Candidatus Woesearchaeota archaeon]
MSLVELVNLYAAPLIHPELWKPNDTYHSVAGIYLENLWSMGIRALIFDVDGTLMPYHSYVVPKEITKKLRQADELGFRMCAVTNTSSTERVNSLEAIFSMNVFMANPGKPHTNSFTPALDFLHPLEPFQIAVVGDRKWTDIYGGKLIGAYTILISPGEYTQDPIHIRAIKLVEGIIS